MAHINPTRAEAASLAGSTRVGQMSRKGSGWYPKGCHRQFSGAASVPSPSWDYQKTYANMFPYKKLAVAAAMVLLGVPSVSMAGSFVVSLVQGKTPTEAVQIIAEQIDLLTGRISTLETKQSDTALEIERLKLENENLRLKTDEVLSGTAEIRANEAWKKQCSELAAQIRAKEDAVRASFAFEARIKPIQDEMSALAVKLKEQENSSAGGDNDIEVFQARIVAAEQTKAQINAKRREIEVISGEMKKALDVLRATAEVKTLQTQLDTLLCA